MALQLEKEICKIRSALIRDVDQFVYLGKVVSAESGIELDVCHFRAWVDARVS